MQNLARLFAMALRAVFLFAVASSTANAALVRFVASGISQAYLLPELDAKPASFQMTYDTEVEPTEVFSPYSNDFSHFDFSKSLLDVSVTIGEITWRATDYRSLGLFEYSTFPGIELLNFSATSKIEPENSAFQPLGIVFVIEKFGISEIDQRVFVSSGLPTNSNAINFKNATSAYFGLPDIPVSGVGIGGVHCAFDSLEIQVIPEPSAFAGALVLLFGQWCSFGLYARQRCQ